ncbi:MAG TPA: glucose 1-dehydrogenase [Longimicrobiales bacterium]|nr:glucose 1-dehydrogenase [Longimicrobiales bacterium]
MLLEGRVALVTGGAAGIGAMTARTFAREGACVVVADVDEARGSALAADLEAGGGRAFFQRLDVTDAEEVDRAVAASLSRFGSLDVLVNNAGIVADARLVKLTPEQWQRVIDVNLKGVFLCGQAAARAMIGGGRGGVILNASSVVGLYGNFGQTNYVATKAGVIGMTRSWARELGRHGIRVNAVAPGFIATEILREMPEKVLAGMRERTPLGRLGEPRDVANAYLYLASDLASFVTGAVLSVDGGLVI